MHWFKTYWKQLIIPALVLFLLGISYALQAGKLGWYLDDWIILEAFAQGGEKRLASYAFMGTRPLVSPLWFIGFWIAKFNPLAWQWWALAWRALSVIFIWLGWRKLFPQNKLLVGGAALLLTVYPIFDQQASALTFSFHWIAFTLWAVSFYLMIKAATSEKYWALFTLGGLTAMMVQLFATEFFIGLEILRPVALWWLYKNRRDRIRTTLKQTLPWLLVLGSYLIWRLLLMPTPIRGDRNSPVMLSNLLSNPISAILDLTSMTIQSLLEGLGGVWYKTIDSTSFTIGPNADFISWLVVFLLLLAGVMVIIRFGEKVKPPYLESGMTNLAFLFTFGLVFFLGGIAPGLSIGRYLSPLVPTSDRFALAAMPGAALMLTVLVWVLLKSEKLKLITLTLLIALSVGFQFRLANNYRRSWQKQERLFWQLAWRMPEVEPYTAFLGNGALSLGLGNWATASALNMIYGDYENPGYVPYWYVDLYRSEIDNDSDPLNFSSAHLYFQWHKSQTLVFQYETEISPCVWVVDPQDANNPDLEQVVREALYLSDFNRIKSDTPLRHPVFLGQELEHEWWCYYFQKGDLASQNENWDAVLDLYQQAQMNNQKPYASSEYIPFIQAAVARSKWDLAEEMTLQASYLTTSNDQICLAWQSARTAEGFPVDLKQRLIEEYRCSNLLEE